MKSLTVITVAYNSAATIEDTIQSAISQKASDFDHVLIDGGSTDGTMAIVDRYRHHFSHVVSEPDKGIYDAMNKGLALAKGEFVGFLNSDDYFFSEHSLTKIQQALADGHTDAVWGDVVQVNQHGVPKRMIKGNWFQPSRFIFGLMPPHPSFYARRSAIQSVGGFDASYRIGGDFELLLRLFKLPAFRTKYIEDLVTVMRIGGVSTDGLGATARVSAEILQGLRNNGFRANPALLNIRYLVRIWELANGKALAIRGHRYST